MKLKHYFFWIILIFFLFLTSFYLLFTFNEAKENTQKYQQKYRELVHELQEKFEYHLRLPDFLEYLNKINTAHYLLFGKNFFQTGKYLKKFASEADAAMNKNEKWKKILTSPADVFLNVTNGEISALLIVFQYPESTDINNHHVFGKLHYVPLSYEGFSFHTLTYSFKNMTKTNRQKKRNNPDTDKRNRLPELFASGDLFKFMQATGISLPLKRTGDTLAEAHIQFEPDYDGLKLNIKTTPGIFFDADSLYLTKTDSCIFKKFNPEHPVLKKGDSLAGFSVLKSLIKNSHPKSFFFRHHKLYFSAGKIDDPDGFGTAFRYLPLYRMPDQTEFAFLSENIINAHPFRGYKLLLLHNDAFYVLTDSSGISDAVGLLKNNLNPYFGYIRESFNENIVFGALYKDIIHEFQNDTQSVKYVKTVRYWMDTQRNAMVDIRIKKLNREMPDWIFQCEANIVAGPFEFVNHNTGSKEIIIQDENKNIYILNANDGNKMTAFQAKGLIENNLFMVDMFKNKKYQMVFKSGNEIHLADRNGKYVNAYPFTLHSRLTTPLNVIFYPQPAEYRMWFGCKDKKVYSYNLFTLIPEKFTPYSMDYISTLPVRYVTYRNSDYLFTIDTEGHVHAFGRKGDARIGFKNKAIKNLDDYRICPKTGLDKGFLIYFDKTEKTINKIYLTDKKEIIKLSGLAESIIDYQFLYPENTILGILTSTHFYLVNDNGEELLRLENKFNAHECDVREFNGSYYIILKNKTSKELILARQHEILLHLKNTANGVVLPSENQKDIYFLGVSGTTLMCYKIQNP